jgi:hypothetical protein
MESDATAVPEFGKTSRGVALLQGLPEQFFVVTACAGE